MQAFFINLAEASARRQELVSGFAARRTFGWNLSRVEAVGAAEAAAAPGRIAPAEKGCFLSHRKAVAEALSAEGPVWILEDDIAFGEHSFSLVDAFIAVRKPSEWDLLVTDIGIGHLVQVLHLLDAGRRMLAAHQATLLDLKPLDFTSAASYVVAADAKQKLFDLHAGDAALDVPYDVFLRRAVRAGKLRASCIFPFATTASASARRSQVQTEATAGTDFLLEAFRRVLCFDRDLAALRPELEALIRDNAEARTYGALIGALLFAARK
jgi:GR25 family glycosyltransferase involved in LPS biosynthesis